MPLSDKGWDTVVSQLEKAADKLDEAEWRTLGPKQPTRSGPDDAPDTKPIITKTSSLPSSPVTCNVCKYVNDQGAPNQSDGSYVCFRCR